MARTRSKTEYVFKVALKGARRISRTIALRGDQTLNDLHETIFDAFDRYEEHLYSFYFPKAPARRATGGPSPREYTAPQAYDGPDLFDRGRLFNAAKTKLDDLRLKPGQKFEYLFDFGDSWWHQGSVEAVNPAAPQAGYPQIRESRGASPPQYPDEW